MVGSSFGLATWVVIGWGGSCSDKLVMSFSTNDDEFESLCVTERSGRREEREREGRGGEENVRSELKAELILLT